MFASFKKMAEGVNLQVANHVVFVDLWWNPQKHFQAADRIHRLDQTKTSYIYYFLYRGIEEVEYCKKIMRRKTNMANSLLNTSRLLPEVHAFKDEQNIKEELVDFLADFFADLPLEMLKSSNKRPTYKPSNKSIDYINADGGQLSMDAVREIDKLIYHGY